MNDAAIIAAETASAALWAQTGQVAGFFSTAHGTGMEEDLCADIIREIPAEMCGHLILQMLNTQQLDKRKWLAIAEVLGPDFGQALYRAAVFVTKVA